MHVVTQTDPDALGESRRMRTDIICRAYYSGKLGAIIICHVLSTFAVPGIPGQTINGEYDGVASTWTSFGRPFLPSHSDCDDYTAFSVAQHNDYTVLRNS